MCPEGLQLKQIINLIVIDMSFVHVSNICYFHCLDLGTGISQVYTLCLLEQPVQVFTNIYLHFHFLPLLLMSWSPLTQYLSGDTFFEAFWTE